MLQRVTLTLASAGLLFGATVIDRIAVVVSKHAIKLSDVQGDVRLTEFMNHQPLNLSPDAMRKSADRLIDQMVIRDEIGRGGYRRPGDSDADHLLNQLRQDRFGGSDSRLNTELARYGLNEGRLREQLLWQLTVLRFIDQRFRPGVQVTDDEVHAYYNQHLQELKREYTHNSSFEALQSKIRASMEGERINQNFVAWLDEARQREHIEYRQGAFQ
jgi:peptidyl-prolyl cis-trans isomerase SurA